MTSRQRVSRTVDGYSCDRTVYFCISIGPEGESPGEARTANPGHAALGPMRDSEQCEDMPQHQRKREVLVETDIGRQRIDLAAI